MSRRTVVILHPGGLGDLLLAVPALHSLRNRFPTHQVLLCGHGEASQLLVECGLVDGSLPLQTTACAGLFAGTTPDDPLLRNWLSRCDYALAWASDESGTLAATLKHCGVSTVVVQTPFASSLAGVHQAERYAEIIGVPPTQVNVPHLSLPLAVKAETGEYLRRMRLSSERPLALVHPSSGSPHKCVKAEVILAVLDGLHAEGFEPMLLHGPADDAVTIRLLARISRRPAVLCGLSVPFLAGVLSHIDIFLGHDSGVTHLAALLGTATVALFGPTDPMRWGPRGPAVTVIKDRPCGCLSWDAVRRCKEKPCLELSPSLILQACLTARTVALNPRNC